MGTMLLSTQEVRELKLMCSNPFLELGMTLRPRHLKCLKPHIATSTMMTIIKFEKHKHAEKWNKLHEERIRRGGHLATIALAVLGGTVSQNYALGIAVASGSGIIKDEVQAGIWYPKMFKGWLLTRYFTFRYAQFPHQNFYMEWTDVIQDENGKERERRNHGQTHCKVGGPYGIPEKLVRDLISKVPKFKSVSFK